MPFCFSFGSSLRYKTNLQTVQPHGYTPLGQDAPTFLRIAYSLAFGADEVLRAVAEELPAIAVIGTDPPKAVFGDDRDANLFLRFLQFRLDLAGKAKWTEAIVRAWDIETQELPDSPSKLTQRSMFLWSVLMRMEVNIDSKTLLAYLTEIDMMYDSVAQVMEEFQDSGNHKHKYGGVPEKHDELLTQLGNIFWVRDYSDDERVEFIRQLRHIPTRTRNFILASLTESLSKYFIDKIWLKLWESDNEAVLRGVDALDAITQEAAVLDCPMIVEAAAAGMAILWDERLKDSNRAREVLNQAVKITGRQSRVLAYQRATICFNRKEYPEALTIFDGIFPTWRATEDDPDLRPIHGRRLAAICAGKQDDWTRARRYFRESSIQAEVIGQSAFAIGAKADEAWAAWKSGDASGAVSLLIAVLEGLDGEIDGARELDLITLKRLVSNTLLWIDRAAKGESDPPDVANPLGACSSQERNEEIRKLPTLPEVTRWGLLAGIELTAGLPPTAFTRFAGNPLTLIHPTPRGLLGILSIQFAFRDGELSLLPKQLMLMNSAIAKSEELDGQFSEIAERLNSTVTNAYEFEDPSDFNTETLIVALLFLSKKTGTLDLRILQSWRDSILRTNAANFFSAWISAAETILLMSPVKAFDVLHSDKEPLDRRLIAAVRIAYDDAVRSEYLLYAQLLILDSLRHLSNHVREFPSVLEEIVLRTWRRKVEEAGSLADHDGNKSNIVAACNSNSTGWQKIAAVLLAAKEAIPTVKLPDNMVEMLKSCI